MSKHKQDPGHDTPAAHAPEGGHAPEAGHGARSHGPDNATFITIWCVLAFLTVVEVAIPRVYDAPWNHSTKMILLCSLAIGKALLVALFFMHLKWETPWLKRIALVPAYMGLAAIILMIETAWRNSLS